MTHYSAVTYGVWSRGIRALPRLYLPFSSGRTKWYGFSWLAAETRGSHFLWQGFNSVRFRDEITLVDIEISPGEELQLLTMLWGRYCDDDYILQVWKRLDYTKCHFFLFEMLKIKGNLHLFLFNFSFCDVKLIFWATWSVKVEFHWHVKQSMTNWCCHRTTIEESTAGFLRSLVLQGNMSLPLFCNYITLHRFVGESKGGKEKKTVA